MSFILDDSTIEAFIIVALACTQLTCNGLDLNRRIEEERGDDRTQFGFEPSIRLTEAKKKFYLLYTSPSPRD